MLVHVILGMAGFFGKCFTTNGFKFAFRNLCILRYINITYAIIRFAAKICERPSPLTQEFRQPNFVIQFKADFREFYNYDVDFKMCSVHFINSCIFTDSRVAKSSLINYNTIIFSLAFT